MEHCRKPASERKKQRNKATAQPEHLWGNFLLRTEARRPNFVRELVDKSPLAINKLLYNSNRKTQLHLFYKNKILRVIHLVFKKCFLMHFSRPLFCLQSFKCRIVLFNALFVVRLKNRCPKRWIKISSRRFCLFGTANTANTWY